MGKFQHWLCWCSTWHCMIVERHLRQFGKSSPQPVDWTGSPTVCRRGACSQIRSAVALSDRDVVSWWWFFVWKSKVVKGIIDWMLGEVRVASHYSLLSQVARLLGCTVQANPAVQAGRKFEKNCTITTRHGGCWVADGWLLNLNETFISCRDQFHLGGSLVQRVAVDWSIIVRRKFN